MSISTFNQIQTHQPLPNYNTFSNGRLESNIDTDTKVSFRDFELLSIEITELKNEKIGRDFPTKFESSQIKEKPLLESEQFDYDVRVEISDFDCEFDFEILDIQGDLASNEIILYLGLDGKMIIKVSLEGSWEQKNEPQFHLNNLVLTLEKKFETPISEFLSSTVWSILGLASKFRILIPQLNYDLTTSVELPLNEITKLLQERQIAYRLMVIEAALGVQLPFPQGFIKGNDIENIAFCYHAIVEREFDWFSIPTVVPWNSNEESLSWLPETNEPTSVTFRPEPLTKSIFGIEILLGVLTARIEKAVFDNYDEAKRKLSKLDNSIVEIKLRSLNGTSRIIAKDVPSLPENLWSEKLQRLINLDSRLDSFVLDKYFALAASTLEGLTEEQKEAILERPDLDEKAFDF